MTGGGEWNDSPCQSMRPCLRERGAATSSPEYLSAMEAQAARRRTLTLLTFYVIIPILWLLPALLYLVTRRIAMPATPRPWPAAPPEAPGRPPPASWRRRRRTVGAARARVGLLCGLRPS